MIVMTGAGGQLGRAVAEALVSHLPPARIRLGTRKPERIADLAARGFRTAGADFDDRESLLRLFDGAEAALIISGDAPVAERIRQHCGAIDAARQAGVGRIVYTSFANAVPESLFSFAAIHAASEAHLKASGVAHTILRNNHYAENLDGLIAEARRSGSLALAGAQGKVAHIARADVAAATAMALATGGHADKLYELTGPEALDLFEVADILSKAWGRPVAASDMSEADFLEALATQNLPPFVVDAFVGIRRAAAAGEYAKVSEDAGRLCGRPVEALSAYLRRA